MQARFHSALGQVGDLRYLWDGELLLIMEREEHGIGLRQTLQHLTKGVVEDALVKFHLNIGLCGFLGDGIAGHYSELITMMVLAEVVGDGIEPGTEAVALMGFLAGRIEPQEGVVHEVGSKVGIIAKSSDEEALQPSGMTVVEFLEGTVAASCGS